MKYTNIFAFAIGAAAGSLATWFIVKKRYEQIAQEEIDSVKAVFTQPKVNPYTGPEDSNEQKEQERKAEANRNKPDVAEYARQLAKEGYVNYGDCHGGDEEDDIPPEPPKRELQPDAKPYVITPDQFREFDDYDVISFMYYADHILADDNDEMVEDIEACVGIESLTHFGEYDDDSVYVRNDRLKVDFEILRSERSYMDDILKSKPYLKKEYE